MNPLRIWRVASHLLLVAACGCATPEPQRLHSEFRVGASREAVRARFGPPASERTLIKDSPAIWGPIEDFWSKLPKGAKVEIWSYGSWAQLEEGSPELSPGTTELYFVDDSDSVDGKGFAPEGVVYETVP